MRRPENIMSTMQKPHIVYCHCAFAQVVPPEVKAAVLDGLSGSGASFEAVPDLCELTARRDPALPQIVSDGSTIVACYPRALRWMFSAAGHPLPEETRILNMRVADAPEILQALALPAGVENP